MERFKNRWVYALAAFLCGLTVLPMLLFIIELVNGNITNPFANSNFKKLTNYALITGVPAAIAALICWPTRSERTMNRMVVAGLLTVIVAFLLVPVPISLLDMPSFNGDLISASLMSLILGSFITFGVPYIIGIAVSLLFVDHSVLDDLPSKKDSRT